MPSQETANVSPTEVTPELGKGALDVGGLLGRLGGRLDKTGTYADGGFRRQGCGQTRSGGGAYDPAFKPLQALGRPTDDMPRFQTGLGKSACPGVRPVKTGVFSRR